MYYYTLFMGIWALEKQIPKKPNLEGEFPNKQLKLLLAWMAIHEDKWDEKAGIVPKTYKLNKTVADDFKETCNRLNTFKKEA